MTTGHTQIREVEFDWTHDCPFNRLTRTHPGLTIDWQRPAVGIGDGMTVGQFFISTEGDALDPGTIVDELNEAPTVFEVRHRHGRVFDCVLSRDMLTMPPEILAECFQVQIREHDGKEEWLVMTSSPRVEEFLFDTLRCKTDGEFTLRRKVSLDGPRWSAEPMTRYDFTDKQLEALRVAYEHGYFESPREAKAEELADELGIAASSFLSRLRRAQRQLVTAAFEQHHLDTG
jgi:predicted DNA binding protein